VLAVWTRAEPFNKQEEQVRTARLACVLMPLQKEIEESAMFAPNVGLRVNPLGKLVQVTEAEFAEVTSMEKTISEQVREFRDEITMLQRLNDDYGRIKKSLLSKMEHEGRRLRLNQIKTKLMALKGVTRSNYSEG